MSMRAHKTITLKLTPKEYDLVMYVRVNNIDLEALKPGSLVYHYDNQNKIRKHELHLYAQPQREGLGFSQESSSG